MPNSLHITLPPLFPHQIEVFNDPHRFRVLAAHRRAGKNYIAAVELMRTLFQGGVGWHICPDYPTGGPMFRLLTGLVKDVPGVEINKSDRIITTPNLSDGYIQIRSANASLRGEGLSLVVWDECIDIPGFTELWQGDIMPTLATTGGRALFISSVFTFDDFWDLVVYAQTSGDPDWKAWVYNAYQTGVIPPAEIEAQRKQLTAARFAREFLCEPQTLGSVFRLDAENRSAQPQIEAIDGHDYVLGVDVGGSIDNTVFAVTDVTIQPHELAYLDAFLEPSFSAQITRLKDVCDRFRPSVVMVESNNFGNALIQQAESAGIKNIRALTTTNSSKANQVESLVLAFEQHKYRVIDDPALVLEFAAFEQSKTPSGLTAYSAAKGHDDRVMATLLSFAASGGTEKSGSVQIVENPFYPGTQPNPDFIDPISRDRLVEDLLSRYESR